MAGFQEFWNNLEPMHRGALVGGLVGAGGLGIANFLAAEKKKRLGAGLGGAAIGGLGGAAVGGLVGSTFGGKAPPPPAVTGPGAVVANAQSGLPPQLAEAIARMSMPGLSGATVGGLTAAHVVGSPQARLAAAAGQLHGLESSLLQRYRRPVAVGTATAGLGAAGAMGLNALANRWQLARHIPTRYYLPRSLGAGLGGTLGFYLGHLAADIPDPAVAGARQQYQGLLNAQQAQP